MVISQKYAAIAVDYTNENRKKKGVILDENYLELYKEKLRKFAKNYNIMENSDLDVGLWTQISLDITYLMIHTTNRVHTMGDEFIRNVNPNEYILAAFNYLIAVTAKELGSPNLPIESFRPFFKSWAQNILTAKPRTDISLDDTFNDQRRIDAVDLRSDRIEPLLTEINNKNNLAENVTKLYAEYQALVRRQANHGVFWRWFHSAENDARTALIDELRETLEQYVPNIDLRSKTPTSTYEVAMAADEEAAVRGINAGVSLDERDIPTVFGYDKEGANNPLSNAQPQINSNNIIAQDSIISQADNSEFELVMEEYNDAIANEEENKEDIKEDIKEENEEDIKEENEEANNEPVEIVKENPQPKILSATEQFNKINNYNLRDSIEDQMWSQIEKIVDHSVSKYTAVRGTATAIIGSAETLNKIYDQVKAVNNNPKVLKTLIHDTIPEIFYRVYKGFELCRLRPKDQLVAAQKMTDIVLNELTVVGFNGAEYSEFAKNYAIANDVGLYDFLATNYPGIFAVDIKDIVDKAREELGVDPSAISNPDIINDVPGDEIIEKFEVEEQPKEQHEEQPKEQAEENNDVIEEEEKPFVKEPIVEEPIVNEPIVEEPIVNEPIVNEPILIESEKKEENEIKIDVAIDDESKNLAVARDILLELLEKSRQSRIEEENRIKAQEEKLKKFAEIAERLAKRGAMSKIEDESLRKYKEEEAKRKAEEEEARIKAEVEAQIKAEEEQRQKKESVNGFIDDLFENASADVEREQRELEEARRKAEEEEKERNLEKIARMLAGNSLNDAMSEIEGEDQKKAEEENKRKLEEEEAKRKLEEENKRKLEEEEAKRKLEEENKRKLEKEEARRKEEEETKRKLEEEEAKRKAEEENKRKLEEEEAKRKAEEENKRKLEEEEAKRKAEAENKRKLREEVKISFKNEEARKLSVQKSVAEAIAADNTPDTNTRLTDLCQKVIDNEEVANNVKSEISNLTRKANNNVTVTLNRARLVENVCKIPQTIMLNTFKNANRNKTNMNSMQATIAMAKNVFSEAFKHTDFCDYSFVERVYIAQGMTDILMKNYSPAAFVPKVFDAATDFYIIAHAQALAQEVRKYKSDYGKEHRKKIVSYGERKENGEPVNAFKERKTQRNEELKAYIEANKKIGENISDNAYIGNDAILAYKIQYMEASGDNKAIDKSKERLEKVFARIGVSDAMPFIDKFFNDMMYGMQNIYDKATHFASCNGTFGDMMRYMSKEVFKLTYDYAVQYDLNKPCQLALAQQLADVILSDYSPALFNDACKDIYTKNFVINDINTLKECVNDENIKKYHYDAIKASENLAEAVEEERQIREYEEQSRIWAEERAKKQAEEEEARRKAKEEEEARRKAEEEEARRQYEEEQRRLQEEARKKAEEEETRKKAEEAKKQKELEEAKKKAEEDAKTKAAEEEAKKKAGEIEARWVIENKQLSEQRKQILEQKKAADDIRAVYQDKLQEMKLAGVSVHELVEAEFAIAATGPSNFSVEVSEQLEKISKDPFMPNAIGKILGNAISNKEERRLLVNSITDTVRRNMISLYSTAEENKINIFSSTEINKCLKNTFKEVYRLTANCGYDFANHIVVAQKITDKFMKDWSPANRSNLGEKYYSGYLVSYSDKLKEVIPEYNKSLHWNDIEQAIKKDVDYNKQFIKGKANHKKTVHNLSNTRSKSLSPLNERSIITSGRILDYTKVCNYCFEVNTSKTKAEIAEIFKEIDSNANDRSERFFSEMKFDLRKMYSDLTKYTNYDVTFNDVMTYMSKKTFELCYKHYLKDDNLTKKKRIELSQKLSNLILVNYSLLAGTQNVKDKYMDFVIRDENVLNDILENSERVNKANARAEEAKEMQKLAAKAQLELKRNYKRVIANPIPTDDKIEQPFIRACRQELNQSFNDSRLTEAFKLQVAKVLNDFGVENVAATNAADAIFKKVSNGNAGMYKIYKELESYVEWGRAPKLFVDVMMDKAIIEFRKLVTDCFEDPAIGIIASRNVMDVILKNYSPAAFAKGDTLRNQVNSFLFDSSENKYFHNYFTIDDYKKDFPEGKIPYHTNRWDFIKWIQEANKKLEREAEAKRNAAAYRERKPVEKYERKVEGVKLAISTYGLIVTDANFNVFIEECKKSITDPNLTEYVKWQVDRILTDSGVENLKIQSTVDNIFNKLTGENGMLAFYDKSGALSVRKDKQEVYFNDMMKNIILRSANFLCDATKEIYSNREVETAVHQKILDVFLKNYSPVPFSKGNVEHFADGFLLAQGDVFAQYYLKNINWTAKPEEINDFLNKVRVVSAELDKKAPANEPAINDDKKPAPEKEQISVDLSKADAPKVDAPKVDEPKVEAPKVDANEPAKERIAVNEALDNVGSAKVSNKVEEIKALVNSKSKE